MQYRLQGRLISHYYCMLRGIDCGLHCLGGRKKYNDLGMRCHCIRLLFHDETDPLHSDC